MAVPPSNIGATQVSAIAVAVVTAALFASEVGGFGFVVMTAPLPEGEKAELPT